jgi:alpha-L-fucosidase
MGEGPQMAGSESSSGSNFNEDKIKPFTAEDVRFTTKGATLYAIIMGAPKSAVTIKSLGTAAKLVDGAVGDVTLLGSDEKLAWSQNADALTIAAPKSVPNDIAVVFKITPRE